MSDQLTDEQLLACPEPVELRFIHRGRRGLIAKQAGEYFKEQDSIKSKNTDLNLKYKKKGTLYAKQLL